MADNVPDDGCWLASADIFALNDMHDETMLKSSL